MNGVINIESRSARDTQGTNAYAGGGDTYRAFGGARYGAKIGTNTFFRVFGSYQLTADYPLANGSDNTDSGGAGTAVSGWIIMRMPTRTRPGRPMPPMPIWTTASPEAYNLNTLGRWRQQFIRSFHCGSAGLLRPDASR